MKRDTKDTDNGNLKLFLGAKVAQGLKFDSSDSNSCEDSSDDDVKTNQVINIQDIINDKRRELYPKSCVNSGKI